MATPSRLDEVRGAALVEVVVAAALLVIVSLGALSALSASTRASAGSRDRTSAAEIAANRLSAMRSTPVSALATAALAPATVETIRTTGQQFTVTRSVDVLADASGKPGCTGATGESFLRLKVSVAWRDMRSARPVALQQLVSAGALSLNGATGSSVVVVRNADGAPTAGARVALSGPRAALATTDAQGCAAFPNLVAGTYSADVSSAAGSLIGPSGGEHEFLTLGVAAQQYANAETQLDKPGSATVRVVTEAADGSIVASTGAKVRLAQAGLPGGERIFADASALAAARLFPFSAPYQVHTGGCADLAPTGQPPAAARAAGAVSELAVARGLRRDVVVFEPGLRSVFTNGGRRIQNVTLRATTCADTLQRTVGGNGRVTDPGLPYGTWTACFAVRDGFRQSAPFASSGGGPATIDFSAQGTKSVQACG